MPRALWEARVSVPWHHVFFLAFPREPLVSLGQTAHRDPKASEAAG